MNILVYWNQCSLCLIVCFLRKDARINWETSIQSRIKGMRDDGKKSQGLLIHSFIFNHLHSIIFSCILRVEKAGPRFHRMYVKTFPSARAKRRKKTSENNVSHIEKDRKTQFPGERREKKEKEEEKTECCWNIRQYRVREGEEKISHNIKISSFSLPG